METVSALFTPEGMIFTVMFQIAISNDLHWFRIEPPVEQVEMMGGLVNEQCTASFPDSVPAPEVGGTMIGIQVPVKID